MKTMKSWIVGGVVVCAAAQVAFASEFDEAPNRISVECSAPEIGRIEADLDLDFGYYYHGMAVHFDTKGNFVEAFTIRQENHGSLGAVYGDGQIWLSIPHSGQPDWSVYDKECVAPAPHAGLTAAISLQDPAQSRIELLEVGEWNPRVGLVFKHVEDSPWPIALHVLDGRICEDGTSKAVELPLTCSIR